MGSKPRPSLVVGPEGVARCFWAGATETYRRYHDAEWGFPVADDHRLFEKICLEGFQSGLSWLTILNKRPRFREVFAGFDFSQVARFGERDIERLANDPGIIRHRGKIRSTINNAQRALELLESHGSLAAYFWSFEPRTAERPAVITRATLMTLAKTPASTRLSADLKKRGWTFVGPTTAYAFMQAMGLVNDHIVGCSTAAAVTSARHRFTPPR